MLPMECRLLTATIKNSTEARVLRPPFLPPSVRRFTTSEVRRSHYEEGPGKNIPFSVENKWKLLAMMTLFFGSRFAAPFFIVRHQLLKK